MSSLLNKAVKLLQSDGYLRRGEDYEVELQYRDGHEFHITLVIEGSDTRKVFADFRVTRGGSLEVADVAVDRF